MLCKRYPYLSARPDSFRRPIATCGIGFGDAWLAVCLGTLRHVPMRCAGWAGTARRQVGAVARCPGALIEFVNPHVNPHVNPQAISSVTADAGDAARLHHLVPQHRAGWGSVVQVIGRSTPRGVPGVHSGPSIAPGGGGYLGKNAGIFTIPCFSRVKLAGGLVSGAQTL